MRNRRAGLKAAPTPKISSSGWKRIRVPRFFDGFQIQRDSAADLEPKEWYEKRFGWTAAFRQTFDDDVPAQLANAYDDAVVDSHHMRRLWPRIVQLDAPACHRRLREAARLEEARRPEPLVDADALAAATRHQRKAGFRFR
jgi:hypothetical protein